MKKIILRRKRILKQIFIVSLCIIMLITCLPSIYNPYADSTQQDGITINKTAKETKEPGVFRITLDVNKKPTVIPDKNADIILIIDKSTSMADKIDEVKKGAKEFVSRLLEGSKGNVRISLITFYGADNGNPNVNNSAYLNKDFINDEKDLLKTIDGITNKGNTYTKGAIQLANTTLKSARKDAKKYVVLFTDGLPNVVNADDKKMATIKRDEYKTNVGDRGFYDGEIVAMEEYEKLIKDYKDVKFYSLGLFTGKDADKLAARFLSEIQNIASEEKEYEERYYTQKITQIPAIFQDISTDIQGQISSSVMKDTVIKDTVTNPFEIIKDTYECTGNINNYYLRDTVVNGQDIIFNLGDVVGYGTVSFLIRTKDPYFGGEHISTNENAEITCLQNDPIGGGIVKVNKKFNIPNVDLPFKKGSITIEKEVQDEKGNKVPCDDNFVILIKGQKGEIYNISEKANTTSTMKFYLKGAATDISSNKDTSLNYFTEGRYMVEETVPMNYSLQAIEIWNNKQNKWEPLKGNFEINKDNRDVKIKVINKVRNNNYWYDKKDCSNKLKYSGY